MSTPKSADQARKMITRIGSLRGATSKFPQERKENQAALEVLLEGLRDPERPKFDELTEGLIESTLSSGSKIIT